VLIFTFDGIKWSPFLLWIINCPPCLPSNDDAVWGGSNDDAVWGGSNVVDDGQVSEVLVTFCWIDCQ